MRVRRREPRDPSSDPVANIARLVASHKGSMPFDCDWDDAVWPLAGMVEDSYFEPKFHFLDGSSHLRNSQPFPQPFADFAKAMVCLYATARVKKTSAMPYQYLTMALRCVYAVTREGGADPSRLRKSDFDHALSRAGREYEPTTCVNVRAKLAWVAAHVHRLALARMPTEWTPKAADPDEDGVGEDIEETDADLLGVAEIWALANLWLRTDLDPFDKLRLCATVIMLCGGFRAIEVLTLPVNALRVEPRRDHRGDVIPGSDDPRSGRVGLQYWPAKRRSALTRIPAKRLSSLTRIKVIPNALVGLVILALDTAETLTTEPRRCAHHQFHNPGLTTVRPEWDELPSDHLFTSRDVSTLRREGYKWPELAGDEFILRNEIPSIECFEREGAVSRIRCVRKDDLYKRLHDLSFHKSCRPMESEFVPLHDQLFVVHAGVRSGVPGFRGTARRLTHQQLSKALKSAGGSKSIFERCDIRVDGEVVAFRPHQLRRFMNTLAMYCGVGDLDLASWMARSNTSANMAYDLRRLRDVLEAERPMLDMETLLPAAQAPPVHPLEVDEPLVGAGRSAHVTLIGACVHDIAFLPCDLHARMVRGGLSGIDADARDGLNRQVTALLTGARAERAAGAPEAGAWISAHEALLTAIETASDRNAWRCTADAT